MQILVIACRPKFRRDFHLLLHFLEQVLEHKHYLLRNNLCGMCTGYTLCGECVVVAKFKCVVLSPILAKPLAVGNQHIA